MNDQQRSADPSSRNKTVVQLPGYGVGPKGPRIGVASISHVQSLGSLMLICY